MGGDNGKERVGYRSGEKCYCAKAHRPKTSTRPGAIINHNVLEAPGANMNGHRSQTTEQTRARDASIQQWRRGAGATVFGTHCS
eukprot:9502252-Pyramimonas_sp.AAC.1